MKLISLPVKNNLLIISYKGSDAKHIISCIQNQVIKALPDVKMMVSLQVRNLVYVLMEKIKRFSIMKMLLFFMLNV